MIQFHLYAKRTQTPVYALPFDEESLIYTLSEGHWLGVLDRKGDWIRVIGTDGEGWVRSTDVEERSPLSLHVHYSSGKSLSFVSTVSSK